MRSVFVGAAVLAIANSSCGVRERGDVLPDHGERQIERCDTFAHKVLSNERELLLVEEGGLHHDRVVAATSGVISMLTNWMGEGAGAVADPAMSRDMGFSVLHDRRPRSRAAEQWSSNTV
jgi:hypothetical protein